ncbi:MAG: TetR/AcrR family transcriptional regulator [Kordiimonadaceae bacterium]|nr:TetR/AcrR family transcriptional regulator [Kordiimonadaceae bacterium]MBO6568893.1 TetR/AcrR family transcriptional regulator [Kordiimonadaceae bacterium]MBO6965132.1 TetR/AcrR family transcriptional regulator [Kordiimonadaceae bacterium]
MKAKQKPAKEKFVETALKMFADKGFYGISLADLASELGLTKQAIIYHFKTKDALYAEVLAGLSARFEAVMDRVLAADCGADEKWQLLLREMFNHMETAPEDARLIMRELLDNSERAQQSHRWYLRRFLNECVALISETKAWRGRSVDEQTAAVYQAVGAINYLAISGPTLEAIWDQGRVAGMSSVYLKTLS